MLIKREKKPNYFLRICIILFVSYFALRVATLKEIEGSFRLNQIEETVRTIFILSTPIVINANTLLIVGVSIFILFVAYDEQKRRMHRNLEKNTYGSAEWSERDSTKSIRDPDITKNQIFTETEIISQDMRASNRSRNVTLVGRPGTGKSRNYFKPNIFNANGTIAITDPKGELLRDVGMTLIAKGYTIKVLNLKYKWKSNCYNPFHYIKKLPMEAYGADSIVNISDDRLAEDDVLTLVNTILKNTKSDNIETPTGDPFWEKGETMLMQSLFFYVLFNYPKDKQNFTTVLELLSLDEANKEDEMSPLDKLFYAWERKDPENIGVKQYKLFKKAAKSPKTMATIVLMVAVRLGAFNIKEIAEITEQDSMELERIGLPEVGKIAYFIITDPANTTFNFIASIFYTQLFSMVDTNAAEYDGYLPLPVDVYLDEFAQLGEIPRFLEILAYVRGLNCGITVGVQSLSQLKRMYKDGWETILDCCDYFLFLGSRSKETLEYVSTLLGKKTWYKKSSGRTYSKQKSNNTNWDEVGRELGTVDELSNMEKGYCILLIAGFSPFYSKLYDLTKHPSYIYAYEPRNSEATLGNLYEHLEYLHLSEEEKHTKKVFDSIGLPFMMEDPILKMRKVSNGEFDRMKQSIILSNQKTLIKTLYESEGE